VPSDTVWVAVIAAVGGLLGGVVGAFTSPIGKDWVSERESERAAAQEERGRQLQQSERAADAHRLAVGETLQAMTDAMRDYDASWRGITPPSYHADTQARKAAHEAWGRSREIEDPIARELVDSWKRAIDGASMAYREGAIPPGHDELETAYREGSEHLAEIARRDR